MKTQLLATLMVGTLSSWMAWAHDGHGMNESHWHATDSVGWVVAVVVVGWYFSTRK
jgi:hypothetical protein